MILEEIKEPTLINLFKKLDTPLVVPQEVYNEIMSKKAKATLDSHIKGKRLKLVKHKDQSTFSYLSNRYPPLNSGEIGVLTLAKQQKKDVRVVIDEVHGRRVANELGIKCNGVFGLLLELHEHKEISLNNLKAICKKINKSNFRIDFKRLGYEWLLK